MRLSLDELRVAEVAARNYPQGGTAWRENGKPCSGQALSDFNRPPESHWIFDSGNSYEQMMRVGEIFCVAARFSPVVLDLSAGVQGVFVGAICAGPTYVADILATIIKAAELTLRSGVGRVDQAESSRDRSREDREGLGVHPVSGRESVERERDHAAENREDAENRGLAVH